MAAGPLIHLAFDIDGTVVDHRDRMYSLYARYAGMQGWPVLDPASYFERKRAGADERAVAGETFPAVSIDVYLDWKRARIETSEALEQDTVIAGMGDALGRLARLSPLVAVSARQSRSLLVEELERLVIAGFFREIVVTGAAKAEALEAYLRGAGIGEADLTLVGDTEVEISAATAVGCRCVSVSWGLRSRAFLEAVPAQVVVDTVGELVSALTDELFRPVG